MLDVFNCTNELTWQGVGGSVTWAYARVRSDMLSIADLIKIRVPSVTRVLV